MTLPASRTHPLLYQINTRLWFDEHDRRLGGGHTLLDLPDKVWEEIAGKGFDWLWLMGLWHNENLDPKIIAKLQFDKWFDAVLPDWSQNDWVGSPYAIREYSLHPMLGKPSDLPKLRDKLHTFGLRLMVDFVPNHFARSTPLVLEQPDLFFSIPDLGGHDPMMFEELTTKEGRRWVAHGKDPYFPPWLDTIQLNYYNPDTRQHMTNQLLEIGKLADGVRCDMAMLLLNRVVRQTWGWLLNQQEWSEPSAEFWPVAIPEVREQYPKFVFMAEVYWNLEWELQQQGFDFTYDKTLYDRLLRGDVQGIKGHLQAEPTYQNACVRFVENHDEDRAMYLFGRDKSLAAASICATLPGVRFFHEGQLEGRQTKSVIFFTRRLDERPDLATQDFYKVLLQFLDHPFLHSSSWALLRTSHEEVLAWQWWGEALDESRLVVVNYSPNPVEGSVYPRVDKDIPGDLQIQDVLTDQLSTQTTDETSAGLKVRLRPYQVMLLNVGLVLGIQDN